jgi:hypothetical protein
MTWDMVNFVNTLMNFKITALQLLVKEDPVCQRQLNVIWGINDGVWLFYSNVTLLWCYLVKSGRLSL